ncbi:hypothetical protein SAMN05421788_11233 [Filimonas lacunae]|uniref:Outer membrane insertion C-terminal signal n=1 Tax=Filimonas lacunae TaxID=477680 RepID=A0A173MKQ9_9BACT|nr:hypothetical protein [Filimonas lacunae]BAV08232.1 hypothetical protein FLA_4265 [Filimonas lacunae]SIT33117.1 hypothetical protein SAMN05421788_11233 [Filimonas lacunae]
MKKQILLLLVVILLGLQARAQDAHYDQALGLKFPGGLSVTWKKFLNPTQNIEAQATFWQKGFRVGGLYEFTFYTFDEVPGLAAFAGPGAHIGFWKNKYKPESNSSAEFGIDGILGLDYKIPDLPINISLDWQPSIILAGSEGFTPNFGGIAIRYTF